MLATGTALAQALPMAASPLLTRLYTPADFGMLAVFLAVVSSLAPASCGKYEVALVVPGADEEGRRLLRVAVRWCLGASLALLAFLMVGQQALLAAIEGPSLSGWILLGPLALLSMSILSIAQFLANRLADYGLMARGKLVQAVSGVVLQLGLGLAAAGFLGLLAGHLVGLVGGAVFLATWDIPPPVVKTEKVIPDERFPR